MKLKLLLCIIYLSLVSCAQSKEIKQSEEGHQYEIELPKLESVAEKNHIGINDQIIGEYSFEVKTSDPDFENGIIPWASIEKPYDDLPNLIDRDLIIIVEKEITIVIDYPLQNEYHFQIESKNGFSRKDLLIEISKHYYQLYKEEEESATVKTLPIDKRPIQNRNETNGKYGIWGHDIGDLVLTDIYIYKDDNGKITVTMNIDS